MKDQEAARLRETESDVKVIVPTTNYNPHRKTSVYLRFILNVQRHLKSCTKTFKVLPAVPHLNTAFIYHTSTHTLTLEEDY